MLDEQLPPLPSTIGAGGARIALYTELFPSLLSSKGSDGHFAQNSFYKIILKVK